jgi:hypothetical protein
MRTTPIALLFVGLGIPAALCNPTSSSANYSILHAPLGLGGGQIGNGSNLTGHVGIGDTAAGPVSNVTPGGSQNKPNYIGQLYDVTSLALAASPATIEEGGTRQLSATATLDDLTTLILAATDVQWSVETGPLDSINASGLAAAGLVFADTPATARGEFQEGSGLLGLLVLDVNPDNFGGYAGDGLNDGWQINFFGPPPNPDADPNANPDNDPDDNTVEFLTGYDPTDGNSFFTFDVIDRTGTTATLELSKIIPGTRYHIERSTNLGQADPWTEFTNFTTLSEVFDHQRIDPNATGARWFYRILVEAE